jgi:hypothetical protein
VFFKQHLDQKVQTSFGNFIEKEIQSIDSQSHAALNRVRGLRRNLALESEFRQKSEVIKGRIIIQSVFMLGLYVAVFIFVYRQSENLDFFMSTLSVTFFVTGFAWTFIDGRKIKWKT